MKSNLNAKEALALLAASVIATLMILVLMHRREMWLDEYHSWLLSGMSWNSLVGFVKGDVHPPLYFVLIKAWASVFGETKYALRSLSLVSHLVSSALLYALCRMLFESRRAVLAATLGFLFAPALAFYATEARMYSLSVMFSVLVLLAMAKIATPGNPDNIKRWGESRRWFIAMVCGSAALFYTHYTALFFISGMGMGWLIAEYLNTRRFRLPVLWGMFTFLLIVPWLPVMLLQRSTKIAMDQQRQSALGTEDKTGFGFDVFEWFQQLVANFASISGVFPFENTVLLILFAMPIVIVMVAGLRTILNKDQFTTILVAIVGVMAAGTLILGGMVERRYLLLTAPAFFLLAGRGLQFFVDSGRERWATVLSIAFVTVLLGGMVRTTTQNYDAPIESVVSQVAKQSDRDDLLLFNSAYAQVPFEFHAKKLGVDRKMTGFPKSVYDWWQSQAFKGWGTSPVSVSETERFVNKLPDVDVWLVAFESHHQDPDGNLREELSAKRDLKEFTPEGAQESGWRLFRAKPLSNTDA